MQHYLFACTSALVSILYLGLHAALLGAPLVVSTAAHAEQATHAIGIQLPLSGSAARYGFECRDGLTLGLAELSPQLRKSVVPVFEDDQASPKIAVGISQKLIRRPDILAVVTFSSSVGLAVNPLFLRSDIPLLTLSGHPRLIETNPNLFDHWSDYRVETKYYLDLLSEKQAKRVAIISIEHDYTLALRDSFTVGVPERGAEVVLDETIESAAQESRSLALKVVHRKADFVFLNLFEPKFSEFVKQLRQFRFNGTILTIAGNLTEDLVRALGPTGSQNITAFAPEHRYPTFLRAMKGLPQTPSDLAYPYICFMGARRLATALNLAASTGALTRQSLSIALASIKKITLDGHEFDTTDRRISYKLLRAQSVNGQLVLSPPPLPPATGQPSTTPENQEAQRTPSSGVQLTQHPAK
jgi:ABC-type branched-subunit amino acid transport system substrate-binding protein